MIINRKVVGGGSNSHPEKYMTDITLKNRTVNDDIDLELDSITKTNLTRYFEDLKGQGHKFKVKLPDTVHEMSYCFEYNEFDEIEVIANNVTRLDAAFIGANCPKIKIVGDLSKVVAYTDAFSAAVTTIDADIDGTSATGRYGFGRAFQSGLLVNVRFVPNTVSVALGLGDVYSSSVVLSLASVISGANSLKDGISGTSYGLNRATKTFYGGTLGTVSTQIRTKTTVSEGSAVTDQSTFATVISDVKGTYVFTYDGSDWKNSDSNVISLATYGITLTGTPAANDTITVDLYNFFTADESGTVTLTNFITNVKGWTLA